MLFSKVFVFNYASFSSESTFTFKHLGSCKVETQTPEKNIM